MADTVPTQCSKDDGEPGPALATAAPVDQATPGGSQALETQTSSKPPPKMSLEVPVVCITPPSPTPGDSQDKPPAESSPEKPNKVDGDPLQYLSCEVPKTSTKYPAAAKESSLGVVPAIILDPLKHNQEPTVLGDSEESRKEDKEQINVQIKSPLDNCPANHPLTDTERSVGKSDTRAEISTEKAASFESVSDSITACNESSTEKLTSDSVASLKTSDVVGNTTVESIPNSASLTENNTDHGAELSENNTKNISPSSKVQTTPVTSSFSSSVAEENVQGLVSSSSQEQVQAPVSENRASKVPLVVTDRSSSLPTVFSDQQSSKVPAAANQSSGSPLSCPSALADTLQSVSSKEESDSSAVSDCIVSQKAHSSRTVQNSSSECGVEVEQSEVSSERSKEKTADSMPDSISVTEKLKEPLESEDVAKASKLTIKKVDEINDGHEVNTAESPKVWSEQDVTPEVPVETIPVIVNTEDREQEKVGKISEVQGNFVSPVIPSSHSSAIASPDNVSSVDAEQLQPVTIGSSLQPLEEVQEASVSGDPSFAAADLALIDSSADEADSIGGLVINSVIGAADGVADFHPDEMETDRELTDISASAPHTVGENCDNADSSDEIEPSAKRMRFENGADDIEDKLQTSRNVNIKVSPIKNGHGLWDACKLRQILLEKGTIILRLHASVDHMEMNDSDKENKDVDFTGIMVEIKDEDQDHILGLASLEPDADLCDPLAIGLTHNLDHTSPPHYSRGYPHHSRGRSTTLQPAMTRPVFKHLQSPPHSQHYMKQDLLGHPQPLEFEEPQLGTTDWAGKEYYGGLLLQRKAFPPSQYPGMSPAPPPPPPRGRKRGRPPLSSRRGHCPPGGFPRSSPSKSRAYGKRPPEPIKYRPPTPPHHLLVSTLLKLNKSHYMANKAESKKVMKHLENLKHDILPGEGRKVSSTGKGSDDEDEICLSVSQPHPTKTEEESVDTDTGLKRGLIKLSCEFCDLVFRKRSALTAHIKHKHRGMQICPICSDKIKVKGKYGMKFHILKNHKDHPHFSCKKCGESFKLQHHLMNHERLKHELMDSEDEDPPQVNGDQSKNDRAFREMEEEDKRKDIEKNEREKMEREKLERDKEKAKAEREKKLREDQETKKKEKESDSRVDREDASKLKGRSRSEVSVGIASKVPPRSISRGKIMNVRPPTKEVTKSKGVSPKPERRITRSKGPIKVRDGKSESESDDDDDDNETAVGAGESSSSSTSSSDSEVEESKKYFCDICELGFSHKFKLKHHQKEKHSRATRSQASTKSQDNKEQEDAEEEEERPEESSREENDGGDDEDEDEDEEDDEEEEIRKEKERKEKERKEKEDSLKCNLCNKQCRSEYQLRLHMPMHNVVKKGQTNKKSAAPSKVYGKAKDQESPEDQLETSATTQVKQIRDTSRVLRSSPHGTVRGTNTESSKESSEKGKEHSPKRKSDIQRKESSEKSEESLREQRESNERPSYLLKVGSLFRCTKCNITFNREKSMTYHLKKIHETLYPFRACEHCGKIFRSCGPYNRHVIQHRVHHCPEANCKAKYRKMLRLKQHQKNAHPNKPFRCTKCVAIFCKESELEKHQEAKHPRVPSDEEEGSSEEEEEEEEADEEEYEKKRDDDPVSKDHVKKREKEKDKDEDDDDNEEMSSPTKRRARCVPISYKEPDDEEDVIPVKKGQPFKNVVVKPTTPEKKDIQNKTIPDRRGSIDKRSKLLKRSCADSDSVEEAKPSVPSENDRKIRPTSNNSSDKSVGQEDKKITKGQEQKLDKKIPPQTKVLPAKEIVSKLDSPPTQKVKSGKKMQQKQVVPGNKKTKVNLSWTAALKAQIRAAKSASKGSSKKKKNSSSEKGLPKVRRRPSSSSGGQLTSQNMDFPYGHSQSQDSLSCQGYFVGEDSMFSLDDSSQMDIMGDYYGAHYPPSEEISDFVPEDDESGPAKIIGFDSF